MNVDANEDKDSLTIENIIFAGSGHKVCIICRSKVHADSVVMPKAASLNLLVLKRMYAPHGVRICTDHLWNDRLLPDTRVNMENRQTRIAKLEPSIILQLFNDLLGLLQEASSAAQLDFMDPCLTNEDYLSWAGWNQKEFEDIPFQNDTLPTHVSTQNFVILRLE
ncbi:unnamed protein product [Rotaria sp. Silwood2]|nr:unnamed protein product [Rotaria sp. Silwood2]CAF2720352.1 unnamed protein product [Rotaria sp. Silwood2]CAF3142368.1 unnamed protein product [Rotaria sp. Silwood2]CAF4554324.1 unnamed protein product [Rotaria sp. Silwood2]CAF4566694.1 unnamed protein product [Rotaria sp. Silwood2]